MSGPPASVARVRRAVRDVLRGPDAPEAGDLVLVAVSGGGDSVALLAATLFEAPRAGLRCGAVTVDHGWTADSAERAAAVAAAAEAAGANPVLVASGRSERSEDAARRARYAALDAAADQLGATRVLLAHSRDDQAETVLLGLARGSGPRALAGMPARRGRYRRPLLAIPRATLRDAAAHAGLPVWDDPANEDRAFARVRVRLDALPALESAIGPGVAAALARSAELIAADVDLLDELALRADPGGQEIDVEMLTVLPTAVRTRLLRRLAVRAGCGAGSLTSTHVAAIEALVVDWHGQGAVSLPDGRIVSRACGRLSFGLGQVDSTVPTTL
jgi:tRNA(Ile)-lysidine synthase